MRKKQERREKRPKIFVIILGLVAGILYFLFTNSIVLSIISTVLVIVVGLSYLYFKNSLKKGARIKKIEGVFPDFLQLMSSNLRAGMTIDKSMLLSAREEFDPLDKEIIKTGRDITTGKKIETSLEEMSERIGSEKISKTVQLIISGIKAGGNLAVLLEQTSVSMRERNFVEKRAASNVKMYVIFIFVAVAVGAPVLFALSSVLVEVLSSLLGGLPGLEQAPANLPFTLSSISISTEFIKYFSVVFIITIDILASLILGLVGKGEEKQGLKYLIPLLLISVSAFFAVRIFLSSFLSGFF
jgi:flagellar protein FlaJ